MKYQYLLYTWGGFYNDEYYRFHGEKPGIHLFDSLKEREDYLKKLQTIENNLSATLLAFTTDEGFHLSQNVIAHRVTRYKGKDYYTTIEFWPGYPYSTVKYMMEDKWYPGFNDYPMGEDFDYENEEFQIVQEWITGSFDPQKD